MEFYANLHFIIMIFLQKIELNWTIAFNSVHLVYNCSRILLRLIGVTIDCVLRRNFLAIAIAAPAAEVGID